MPRIPVHTIDDAPEQSRDALKRIEERFGTIPNIFGEMAHAPAMLQLWLNAEDTLAEGSSLDQRTREAIHLAVSAENECDYCQSAYTVAARAAGWEEDETVAIRAGRLDDPTLAPLLALVREAVANQGFVTDETWAAAIDAGWSTSAVIEAFADGLRTIMTNYFNHFVDTDLDMPAAPGL